MATSYSEMTHDAALQEAKDNRELVDVNKIKESISFINQMLERNNVEGAIYAVHLFITHIHATLGQKYKLGFKVETQKKIKDFSIVDLQRKLHGAVSADLKEISIQNPKFYVQLLEAIEDVLQDVSVVVMEATDVRHKGQTLTLVQKSSEKIFHELSMIVFGLKLFPFILDNRGGPENFSQFCKEEKYDETIKSFKAIVKEVDAVIKKQYRLFKFEFFFKRILFSLDVSSKAGSDFFENFKFYENIWYEGWSNLFSSHTVFI